MDGRLSRVSSSLLGRASLGMVAALLALPAGALALPDGRVYERVTPAEKNDVEGGSVISTPNGELVDWGALGGMGDATSAALNLYQSSRTPQGWQTTSLTPKPPAPLGILQEQAPMFESSDLTRTIFTTPSSYDPGDQDTGALDLYLGSPGGQLSWISRGTIGGTPPNEVTFDGA